MASILARHAFRALRQKGVTHVVPTTRTIYATPVAFKKKGKVDIDDLFSEDAFEQEELVKIEDTKSPQTPNTPEIPKSSTPQLRKKLNPTVRRARFEEQVKYIEPRVGRNPTIHTERVRKRQFLTLLDLATSEEELRTVVNLVPKFKETGGELIETFAEQFARRCQELQCQPLALEVFGNYAKYDIWLDIKAARWLVHSLYFNYPLKKVMIATALYPVYKLPHFSEDLASAAMVAAACYKSGTPEALKVVDVLRPQITAMLEKVELGTAPDHATRKHNKWITWALKKVNRGKKDKEPYVPWDKIPIKIQLQPPQPFRALKETLEAEAASPQAAPS